MPTALTRSSRRPSRRSASWSTAARGCGVSTATTSPSSTRSRSAARWRASPSGIAYARSTARRGPGRKPASTSSGIASVSTGSPSKRSTASRLSPVRRACSTRAASAGRSQPLLGIAQRNERAAAALDEERRLAAEHDDVRAGDPRRPRAGALRPWQRSAVGLGGVGGGEHERRLLFGLLAQALDGAGERELRPAEALDEVAATADAERLQLAKLSVDRRVAAGDSLAAHAVAGDDALPLEQELGERTRIGLAGEEPGGRETSGPASR